MSGHKPRKGYHFRYCIEHTVGEAKCSLIEFLPTEIKASISFEKKGTAGFPVRNSHWLVADESETFFSLSISSRLFYPESEQVTNMHAFLFLSLSAFSTIVSCGKTVSFLVFAIRSSRSHACIRILTYVTWLASDRSHKLLRECENTFGCPFPSARWDYFYIGKRSTNKDQDRSTRLRCNVYDHQDCWFLSRFRYDWFTAW